MASEITSDSSSHVRRFHPWAWIGWILAVLFLIAALLLARHVAWLRHHLNVSQGDASQLRLQLDHANQIVAVLTSPESAHVVLTETRQPPHPVGQVSWLANKGALVFVAGG